MLVVRTTYSTVPIIKAMFQAIFLSLETAITSTVPDFSFFIALGKRRQKVLLGIQKNGNFGCFAV